MHNPARDVSRGGERESAHRATAPRWGNRSDADGRVLRGRAEFHAMFSDLARRKRNGQLACFGILGLTTYWRSASSRSRHSHASRPTWVEVDRLGRAQAIAPGAVCENYLAFLF
jgi:hypothetical protein